MAASARRRAVAPRRPRRGARGGGWRSLLRAVLPLAVVLLCVRVVLKGGRLVGQWRTPKSTGAAPAVSRAGVPPLRTPPSPLLPQVGLASSPAATTAGAAATSKAEPPPPAVPVVVAVDPTAAAAPRCAAAATCGAPAGEQPSTADVEATTAVLLFTHSRADYLETALASVAATHPRRHGALPLFVSQDAQGEGDLDTYANVTAVLTSFGFTAAAANITYTHWAHTSPYPHDVNTSDYWFLNVVAYRKITRHYGYALRRLFTEHPTFQRVIILEDDMRLAPDAFDYWVATAPLLDADPTLYCVSGWNDNGKAALSGDTAALHRTDWFPGLGWTLTRSLYEELAPKWPTLFWDDWMRHPDQRRGRHCIRPEVSRVANFGEAGASSSYDYKAHISQVVTAEERVDWAAMDFAYLDPDAYAAAFWGRLRAATLWRYTNYLRSKVAPGDVAVRFPPGNIDPVAKRVGAMADHRHGVWRTSYGGVVVVPWGGRGRWAFLVPRNWEEVLPPDVQLQEPT